MDKGAVASPVARLILPETSRWLVTGALRHAPDRGGIHGIGAGAETDVAFVGADPVRGVESDPAQIINIYLCPGVRSILLHTVIHHQIAADISGG